MNPEFIKYLQQRNKTISKALAPGEHAFGYLPTVIDLSYLKGRGKEIKAPELMKYAASLPSSYDLRTTGRITSVKDQGAPNSCWTFATYGSLESYLMPGQAYDFSEQNMFQCHGFDYVNEGSGNFYMSTAYLARWSGPFLETQYPYPNGNGSQGSYGIRELYSGNYSSPAADPTISSAIRTFTPQFHVQNVYFIPDRENYTDNNLVKSTIMAYGACAVGMKWKDSCYDSTTHSYYNEEHKAYDHVVCIAGWNDNYPSTNFKKHPPGNGAFIIKNSWGTDWGDNGYFYMSYYDASLTLQASFNNAESSSNYSRCYEYDPLGNVNAYGYGTDTAYMADIFMASNSNVIRAVSIYANAPNTTYQIWIYKNPDPGEPVSGTLVKTYSGTLSLPGYNTIKFGTSPSIVTAQHRFSVVIKVKTPGYNYPIAMCYRLAGYSSAANGYTGQSFISPDGVTWTDASTVYTCGHACIKAFAN